MNRAAGRMPRRVAGEMNRLEASFDALLARSSTWRAFEAVKLTLAPNTTYTPDFLAMGCSTLVPVEPDELVVFEVKGFWQDDARVKIKVAAAMFPMRFFAVTHDKRSGWAFEEIA